MNQLQEKGRITLDFADDSQRLEINILDLLQQLGIDQEKWQKAINEPNE